MTIFARLPLALLIAAIAGVAAFCFVPRPLPELTRAEFFAEVRAGHVRSIVIEDQEVITGISTTLGAFRAGFRKGEDAGLPSRLRAMGIEIRFERSALGLI
jgi:hypothetical protein